MKQFLLFIKKEFLHVFRDSKTLLMLFGLPIAQILLFGFALSNEIKNTQIAVLDYSKTKESRALIQELDNSNYFDVKEYVYNSHEANEIIRRADIRLLVIIPQDFQQLKSSNKSSIQLITDASDPNTGNTIVNYASAIIQEFTKNNNIIPKKIPIIQSSIRMLYNPQLKGAPNFVPGVIAMVLMLVCVMMTSISIVKEKENGTMEVLLASPFNPILVILSKAIPYLILSISNVIIILLLSVYLLELPIQGSIILLLIESTLFIITSLSIGLFISTRTDSQQTAMLISLMAMMLPTLIFSGFMFPIENMPLPLQIISNIIPAKWFYIIVKAVMIKGLSLIAIWKETLVLVGMAFFFILLSWRNFKIRLA